MCPRKTYGQPIQKSAQPIVSEASDELGVSSVKISLAHSCGVSIVEAPDAESWDQLHDETLRKLRAAASHSLATDVSVASPERPQRHKRVASCPDISSPNRSQLTECRVDARQERCLLVSLPATPSSQLTFTPVLKYDADGVDTWQSARRQTRSSQLTRCGGSG